MNVLNLENVDTKKILASLQEDSVKPRPKGRRKRDQLDDFTHEEKIIRRKLKNRVAAQTARDRKREQFSSLEVVVVKLQNDNSQLRKRNEELQFQVRQLTKQNEDLNRMLQLTPPQSPTRDSADEKTAVLPRLSAMISTPVVPDHAHIISSTTIQPAQEDVHMTETDQSEVTIKTEEGSATAGYASPTISLPQKAQILLASLITLWLASNPRLSSFLICLSSATQDRFVKSLLHRKLSSSTARSSKTARILRQLFQADLSPILRACLEKKLRNCPPTPLLARGA